ncbi:hypothetical protein QYM36_005102 [Artemia franciscana]|uniref:Uncharacterized protein n=1 Tax=Artemia franciscana TaxID=6661 RepID=A0AA88L781_ARTSF|nr:hypothetical protein QYM36_005102 [Artemia franciscana]
MNMRFYKNKCLQTELYYVREGVLNDYALNFVVPVPFHISELFFRWEALNSKQIPYSMVIIYDWEEQGEAIYTPTCNIPSNGFVPKNSDTFEISIPCTGKVSVEVDVTIQVNVSSVAKKGDGLSLNLKRKKICLKGTELPLPPNTDTRLPSSVLSESLINVSNSMIAAVATACVFIIFVLFSTAVFYVRKKKNDQDHYGASGIWTSSEIFEREKRSSSICSYATIDSVKKPLPSLSLPAPYGSLPISTYVGRSVNGSFSVLFDKQARFVNSSSVYNSPAPSSKGAQSLLSFKKPFVSENDRLRQIAVLPFRITPIAVIEEGRFGIITKGLFLHPETKVEGQVLIKTLKDQSTSREKIDFLLRASLFVGLQFRNLLIPVAACIDIDQPMIVYNSWKHNLKRFLVQSKSNTIEDFFNMETVRQKDGTEMQQLSLFDLIDIACQVGRGLLYLHQKGIVHKDVAARNCVLNERMVIKLSDGALSKDFFSHDYEVLENGEISPLKWMALESIEFQEFDSASDVWSYGVFLWELATLGDSPYGTIEGFEMLEFLKDGLRLLQPQSCPDELFAMMACCWLEVKDQRPTLPQILAYLEDFREATARFKSI